MVLPLRGIALGAVFMAATSSLACLYGGRVDATQFSSVTRNESGAVLYTVQELVYRPAAGIAAFPDGGIPWYVRDRNLVGIVEPGGARPRVVRVFENRDWQHGQGQLTIHSFKGPTALIVESGQRRADYTSDVRYYMVDTRRARFAVLSLKQELGSRGRDVGYFYLLDEAGTLLLVTPPIGSSGRTRTSENQIWLRKASGDLVLVAAGADLYQRSGERLVYWDIEGRKLREYDVTTGITRTIDRQVPAPEHPADREIRISSDRKALESWSRDAATGAWQRERTVLTLERAR